MMKRYATLLIPVVFLLFFGAIEGFSQAKYQLAPNSQLKVEGGST